ncbi:MAG TPA: phage tail protein [Bryobacteraceae bacterium]|nr:phage tail protein [Bryobacteraceae bacterium]
MPQFPANADRMNPYPDYAGRLYLGQSATPAAGISKISGLTRSSDVIEYRTAGSFLTFKGLGRTKYEAVTIERGVTQDKEFEEWANAAQVLDKGSPSRSLKALRKEVRIELLNEAGQPVHRYLLHRCWVSEFQILNGIDAGANGVAMEHIKIEHEGWEHDLSLPEPKEI